MRMGRQVFGGGAPRFVGAPFAGQHFVDRAFLHDYVPYYYDYGTIAGDKSSGHLPAGNGLTPALATMATTRPC